MYRSSSSPSGAATKPPAPRWRGRQAGARRALRTHPHHHLVLHRVARQLPRHVHHGARRGGLLQPSAVRHACLHPPSRPRNPRKIPRRPSLPSGSTPSRSRDRFHRAAHPSHETPCALFPLCTSPLGPFQTLNALPKSLPSLPIQGSRSLYMHLNLSHAARLAVQDSQVAHTSRRLSTASSVCNLTLFCLQLNIGQSPELCDTLLQPASILIRLHLLPGCTQLTCSIMIREIERESRREKEREREERERAILPKSTNFTPSGVQ